MDDRIPASNFCATLAANVDSTRLSDAEFRQFVRNSLPIVDYPRPKQPQPITLPHRPPQPVATPHGQPQPIALETRVEVEAAFEALIARMPLHHRANVGILMHMCVDDGVHSFKHRITRKGFDFVEATGDFHAETPEGRIADPDEVLRWVWSEE